MAENEKTKQVLLIILDGWGIGPDNQSNPIHVADPKTLRYLRENYKSGSLQASGIAVGLPWGEVGNSEVGHLTIGAGKVIYQHYPRITMAIQNQSFFSNQALLDACNHAKETGGSLHLAGLLTEGHVHAAFEHLESLISLAKQQGIPKLFIHIFTDGKDGRPQATSELLPRLEAVFGREGIGSVASLSGRHFAMDRDSHFDRIEATYKSMTGQLPPAQKSAIDVVTASYAENITDQGIRAAFINPEGAIQDGDSLVFFNYREDSIRQLAQSFIKKDYDKFPVRSFQNLHIVTMTDYGKEFQVPVAFPQEEITMPLARVLAEHKKTQLQIAETEKYAHVSYFFNGFRDESFEGQEKILIPSNNVESHSERPEMKVEDITTRIIEKIEQGVDFIVANFANADIVAHSGNYNAEIAAIKAIDAQLARIVRVCEEKGTYLFLTADHGNAEIMIDPIKGTPQTGHDPSAVPLYVVGPEFKANQPGGRAEGQGVEALGVLSDIAPTILELMGIPKPPEMSGESLLDILQ